MPFIELNTTESTNNYAFDLIHDGLAEHKTIVFAHEQTTGKGQRGKIWNAEKGKNIIISIIIKPGLLRPEEQFLLSICSAVAVCDFFNRYADGEAKIKWPNDIYWEDRKAGGILIESIIGKDLSSEKIGNMMWKWAVVGIGININQTVFPAELPNPVSLKQITDKNFDILQMAKDLGSLFFKEYELLKTKEGKEAVYKKYLGLLYKKGETIILKKNNIKFEAIIKTVLPNGELIVEHGIEERFKTGEIEWVNSLMS